VTFALQNQFSFAANFGTPVTPVVNTTAGATGACTPPSKPVGAGIFATAPVTIEEMTVLNDTTVRVKARTSIAGTSFNAIAYCLSIP
jgi:hypothetical protein